jgi:hypothetical protein
MTTKVDQVMDGLTGDFRVGERYYIFTVTYAYIATIARVTDFALHLENTTIVSQAGSAADAVTQIVHGKKKPEVSENLGAPMFIARQAVVSAITMQK